MCRLCRPSVPPAPSPSPRFRPLQNGQVYVVENNQLLKPLVKTAAQSCINPNVWFDHRTWSPGTLTNYASSRRLFKESHQPNRRYVCVYYFWGLGSVLRVLGGLLC